MKKFDYGTRVVIDSSYGEGRIEGHISNIQTDFEILSDYEKVIFDIVNFEKLIPYFKERCIEDGCLVVPHKHITAVRCKLNRRAR